MSDKQYPLERLDALFDGRDVLPYTWSSNAPDLTEMGCTPAEKEYLLAKLADGWRPTSGHRWAPVDHHPFLTARQQVGLIPGTTRRTDLVFPAIVSALLGALICARMGWGLTAGWPLLPLMAAVITVAVSWIALGRRRNRIVEEQSWKRSWESWEFHFRINAQPTEMPVGWSANLAERAIKAVRESERINPEGAELLPVGTDLRARVAEIVEHCRDLTRLEREVELIPDHQRGRTQALIDKARASVTAEVDQVVEIAHALKIWSDNQDVLCLDADYSALNDELIELASKSEVGVELTHEAVDRLSARNQRDQQRIDDHRLIES